MYINSVAGTAYRLGVAARDPHEPHVDRRLAGPFQSPSHGTDEGSAVAEFGNSIRLLANREFASLAGTAFARSQAYSTILIAIALYADLFGTTGFIEGLFGTAFAAVQLLIVLPLGRRVDVGNAKRWLLAGFLINVGVFLGFMLVGNPVHVILVRMLQGLGASVLWITGATVISEISPDGERGLWLGSYNQFASFSSLAGDLIGGYLLYAYGFTETYLVLTLITLGAFALVFAFLRDNPGGRKDPEEAGGIETFRSLLGLPMLRSLVFFRFTFSVGKMAVIIFLPIYARTTFGISAFAIGWIMAGGEGDEGDHAGVRRRPHGPIRADVSVRRGRGVPVRGRHRADTACRVLRGDGVAGHRLVSRRLTDARRRVLRAVRRVLPVRDRRLDPAPRQHVPVRRGG